MAQTCEETVCVSRCIRRALPDPNLPLEREVQGGESGAGREAPSVPTGMREVAS